MIGLSMLGNVISGIIGAILFLGCVSLWLAGWLPPVKRGLEELFTPNEDIFDSKASYAGTVTFLRWWGWFTGMLLFLPTFVIWDVLILAMTITIWIWLAKRAKTALSGT